MEIGQLCKQFSLTAGVENIHFIKKDNHNILIQHSGYFKIGLQLLTQVLSHNTLNSMHESEVIIFILLRNCIWFPIPKIFFYLITCSQCSYNSGHRSSTKRTHTWKPLASPRLNYSSLCSPKEFILLVASILWFFFVGLSHLKMVNLLKHIYIHIHAHFIFIMFFWILMGTK